jgi:hypothetical protein
MEIDLPSIPAYNSTKDLLQNSLKVILRHAKWKSEIIIGSIYFVSVSAWNKGFVQSFKWQCYWRISVLSVLLMEGYPHYDIHPKQSNKNSISFELQFFYFWNKKKNFAYRHISCLIIKLPKKLKMLNVPLKANSKRVEIKFMKVQISKH